MKYLSDAMSIYRYALWYQMHVENFVEALIAWVYICNNLSKFRVGFHWVDFQS